MACVTIVKAEFIVRFIERYITRNGSQGTLTDIANIARALHSYVTNFRNIVVFQYPKMQTSWTTYLFLSYLSITMSVSRHLFKYSRTRLPDHNLHIKFSGILPNVYLIWSRGQSSTCKMNVTHPVTSKCQIHTYTSDLIFNVGIQPPPPPAHTTYVASINGRRHTHSPN